MDRVILTQEQARYLAMAIAGDVRKYVEQNHLEFEKFLKTQTTLGQEFENKNYKGRVPYAASGEHPSDA